MKIEISNPHYHPDSHFAMELTKKRDLSVSPHWVANERIEKDGKSYAIVMPPRDEELWEDTQEVHVHMPKHVFISVNGVKFLAKVKLHDTHFAPVVHFDNVDAEKYGIKGGEVFI